MKAVLFVVAAISRFLPALKHAVAKPVHERSRGAWRCETLTNEPRTVEAAGFAARSVENGHLLADIADVTLIGAEINEQDMRSPEREATDARAMAAAERAAIIEAEATRLVFGDRAAIHTPCRRP